MAGNSNVKIILFSGAVIQSSIMFMPKIPNLDCIPGCQKDKYIFFFPYITSVWQHIPHVGHEFVYPETFFYFNSFVIYFM